MDLDTQAFVSGCSVCALWKTSHPSLAGLPCPLPVPSSPCSRIALDFVTGLSASQGNTTILTIVERFSKSVHFVALPKLRTVHEMAEFLVNHVFRLHANPNLEAMLQCITGSNPFRLEQSTHLD